MTVPFHVKQQQQIYVNFHRQTHPLLSLFIILVNFTQNVSYADLQSNLHQQPLFFVPADSPYNRELKEWRLWATHVNRKLPFFIFGRWFCPNFQSNRLYKSKETKQYKLHSVKAYYKGKVLTSGWRPLLKNVFA